MNSTKFQRFSFGLIIRGFVFLFFITIAGSGFAGNVTILDKSHYSSVFGEVRNYRIFLPPGYAENQETRYPVIYYYHGWSQRYFGSINDFKADEGESNGGDNIANFVATHNVIVVKPDGYNRRPNEEYYLRPYNIGPVETYRQFPLYFPELVDYIDNHYLTIPDREHRAITGLSMGGFMTWWISGKYPHLVSAAGNFCGSVEFVAGPQNSPVEYRHLDMFDNYGGVNVRLNYGDEDFIRDYHKDVNKIWTQVMDNYEYEVYPAAHSACGLGDMFEFCLKTFENPPAKPNKWNHIDVYPSFEVWGYQVNSNRKNQGFTILENVNNQGFKCAVRSFLPDGELMPFVKLSVVTPPIYKKEQQYEVLDIDPETGKSSNYTLTSDSEGRLKIEINGGMHDIGISDNNSVPNISIASFKVANMNWVSSDENVDLSVQLLNKGFGAADEISVKLTATRKSAVVLNDVAHFGTIQPGEIKESDNLFTFRIKSDSVEIERFNLQITDGAGNVWSDFIDVQIRNERNELKDFVIADGKEFEVAAAGDDTVSLFLGKGNGDGIANPGESIVLLANENGRLFRTMLHTSDSQVNPFGIHLRESDYWGTYDHVGASAKYSIPVLASESSGNETVQFFAEYWLPDYPEHIIKRGIVNIRITGIDETPPVFRWVKIEEDNTIQVKLYDGAKISSVKTKLVLKDKPSKTFEIELFDDNTHGDRVSGDLVFSKKIEEMGFGLYSVSVTAEDVYGNVAEQDWPEVTVIH